MSIPKEHFPGAWYRDKTIWGDDCSLGYNSVIGIEPQANAATRRPIKKELSAVRIGNRTIIGAFAAIYMDVHMGDDCRVGDHVTIREGCRIGKLCVIGTNVDVQYDVTIADNVRLQSGTQIAGGTTIGEGTFIAQDVHTANDPYLFNFDLKDYRDRGQVGPTIGRFVKIGPGAILLPGVVIGDEAIIGAGALVTRDVEPGTKMFGLPARPVRSN